MLSYTASVHDVDSLSDLLGDVRLLRSTKVAQLALRALDRVERDSEVSDVSDDDDLGSSLEAIRVALRSPTQRWTAKATAAPRVNPLHRDWAERTVLSIDLGDGHRTYAQLIQMPYIAFYNVRQPVTDPPITTAEVVSRPILFIISVNSYWDRPEGWRTIGPVPESAPLLARPHVFMQDIGDPQKCTIVDPDWIAPRPATQQECIGLERAGGGWYPSTVEERLRCHYAGQPHPETEREAVRISHSFLRVCTRQEAQDGYDAWRFPADDGQAQPYLAFYPDSLVPHFALQYGRDRDDLVMIEVDEAAMHIGVMYGPAIPDDPHSAVVPWTPWISRQAIIRVHDLVPTPDGSYQPAHPWTPLYP